MAQNRKILKHIHFEEKWHHIGTVFLKFKLNELDKLLT